MVKCCVFFAVRTEYLNIVWTSVGFEGLMNNELEGMKAAGLWVGI
jgi:hypothetical protein